MLILRVMSLNGQAPARPIEARFDKAGGTIGRADTNRLVLPDTLRHVSRVHARIVFRAGGFEVVDQGDNPIDVNGVPVGSGKAMRLRPGDRLRICSYLIDVAGTVPAAETVAGFQVPAAAEAAGLGFGTTAPALRAPPLAARTPDRAGDVTDALQPPAARADPARPSVPPRMPPVAPVQAGARLGQPPSAPPQWGPLSNPGQGSGPIGAAAASELDTVPPASASPRRLEAGHTMPIVHRSPTADPAAAPALPIEPTAAAARRDALASAFLAGLGAPDLPLQRMTPEMLKHVGQLLREATQGTLDLLLARTTSRRELRATASMSVGHDDNPLKSSPDVAAALGHLITPQGSGLLAPQAALRGAYDDLRAHQAGLTAGLRAGLAGVLESFDPALLEQRLERESSLDSLPMDRRAQLWDLYVQCYRDIAGDAEGDFQTLFGREFLRVVQQQAAPLQQEHDDSPG